MKLLSHSPKALPTFVPPAWISNFRNQYFNDFKASLFDIPLSWARYKACSPIFIFIQSRSSGKITDMAHIFGGHSFPLRRNSPLSGARYYTVDDTDKSCFSCAVGAQKSVNWVFRHRKTHAIQRDVQQIVSLRFLLLIMSFFNLISWWLWLFSPFDFFAYGLNNFPHRQTVSIFPAQTMIWSSSRIPMVSASYLCAVMFSSSLLGLFWPDGWLWAYGNGLSWIFRATFWATTEHRQLFVEYRLCVNLWVLNTLLAPFINTIQKILHVPNQSVMAQTLQQIFARQYWFAFKKIVARFPTFAQLHMQPLWLWLWLLQCL